MTRYELFVTLLGARSNIPAQAEDLVNDSVELSNQEQVLDLMQSCVYCLVTIASN